MGKLVRLEVFNFKSYRGKHTLLFGDSYFTSIIGPNGSGKSNSMDAISFVLGVKSNQLRSTNLRDLIYRGRVLRTSKINADGTATEANGDADGESQENGSTQTSSQRHDPQHAYVKAVFEDDAEQIHEWQRTITASGASEYKLNGRVVSSKAYNDALEEHSILVKARNFLVFQGDVEAVATRGGKDLTQLIEQISGSLEYKPGYEALKLESDAAAENSTQQLAQRRQINAELRTYAEQKAEADAYEQKVAERDQAVVTHALWKLFLLQQTMRKASEKISSHQEELKEFKRGVEKYQRRLDEARQAQAKVTREVNKTDKNIKDKEKEVADASNRLVPIDEKIKISTADLAKYEERINALKKDRDTQSQLIAKWQNDLATVQKAQQKWEDEFRAAAQQQGRELSAQDIQEYNRLRSDVTKRTHANQIEIDRLKREVDTDRNHVHNLQEKVEALEAAVTKLTEDVSQLTERQKTLKSRLKELEKDRSSKQQHLDKLRSDRRQLSSQYQEYNQMLQETIIQLRAAEGGRQESRKQARAREAVAQMKRIFGSSVRGRYRDVITPKQRKYRTAVNTLLGWHLDAIIVDTDKTARDCIQYLKEQKLGYFTFIPLDTITIKAVNQNLKGMHEGMRLGIDCIDYDPSLERAMASACGNSMICDSLQIARDLVYGKGVGAKAVTLDGSIISKAGLMTGGRLGDDNDRNDQQFDDSAIETLQKKKEKYESQLASLPKLDQRYKEESDLQVEIIDLDDQIRRIQDELRALDRNIQDKKKELTFQKSQLMDVEPNYRDRSQRLQNREADLKQYQDAVDQVADEVFATFCQRLGYASIRDYESQQGSVQQEAAEKRLEFTKQRSRLQNMLAHVESQLSIINDRIKTAEEKSKRDITLIQELEAEREELQNSIDVLNAELESFKESLEKLEEKQTERANVVKEARRALEQRSEKVKRIMKDVDEQEAEIKLRASERFGILRKCRVDEIKIPLTANSAPLNSLPMTSGPAAADPDAMDVDEDPDSTQIHQPEVDDYGIEVDFDELDDELKTDLLEQLEKESQDDERAQAEATTALKEAESKLLDAISALDSEISKSTPNMRAGDRLKTTEAKLRDIEQEWTDARKRAQEAKRKFEDVKQKRLELFQKAFNHISDNIGGTYKDLTKSTAFPLGGQAYLDMEDSTEPYLAGLKYHAMPPLKRFRDMEHLSGGEKTIAALALLFAIHSYQPSPFFVLDEVDAALDNVNVGRVAKYVREHASPGMQFIVISLKAAFFQESESLVGVMRDQSKMSSRVVSLDLRKYQ